MALILGVLGDALLRAIPWGLNISLWMGVLVVVLMLLGRWREEFLKGGGSWLLAPVILFSAALAWRDSPALKMLNVLAMLVALSLMMLRAQGGQLRFAGLMEYALGGVIAGLNAVLGFLSLLFRDIEWKVVLGDRQSQRSMAVGRGFLIAFPLLLVFGGLFVAADSVFEGIVEKALHLSFYELFTHFFITAFCTWMVGGFLRGMLLGKEWELAVGRRVQFVSLGIIETGIVLGLLDLLFFFFVLVQFRFFFGGSTLVGVTRGLTYAEYARRGFFQLVTVAALVLPLLLLAHWLLGKDNPPNERLFGVLAGVQVLLLFVIMASAVQRMRLYQQEFGLTELRLYATAFMGWLAVVFLWFLVTVLRGQRERFAFGALVAGFLLIAVLHFLNPDAFIARTNVARAIAGRSFDARYAGWLSADAVPALALALPALSPQALSPNERCTLAARILKRWSPPEVPDWRTWSRARAEAARVVQENDATLRAIACPATKE